MLKKAVILFLVVVLLPALAYAQSCVVDEDCGVKYCKENLYYRSSVCIDSECTPLFFTDDPCEYADYVLYAKGEVIVSPVPILSVRAALPYTVLNATLEMNPPSTNYVPALEVGSLDSGAVHQFMPAAPLTAASYRLRVNGTQPTAEKNFTVVLVDMPIALALPPFGASSADIFDIVIWTPRVALCRYSAVLQGDYNSMPDFTVTNSKLHRKYDYSPVLKKIPFFIKCNDSFLNKISSAQFDLIKDTTAPVISNVTAVPDVISDYPLSTTLHLKSDDEVVCKYDPTETSYDLMNYVFSGDDEKILSSYSKSKSGNLADLVDGVTYLLNVACKNRAGLASTASSVSFIVDTEVTGRISNLTPKDGASYGTGSIVFSAYTNKNSICWYGNTTDPQEQSNTFSVEGRSHTSSPLNIPSGQHTYYIKCCFDQCQTEEIVTTKFLIDSTPPPKPVVDDSTDLEGLSAERTYSVTTLSASWSSNDNESGIAYYNYTLYEGYQIMRNWTSTTATSVTLDDLSLTNGRTYYFYVIAVNGVNVSSETGISNGVTVDTSAAPVSCTNSIRDGNESDVDCGGGCTACSLDKNCNSDSDCKSGYCTGGKCKVASCDDGVKNQGEGDVDCGGPCTEKCAEGKDCNYPFDCESGYCSKNVCIGETSCANGKLDDDETDVDCGGICARVMEYTCVLGKKCFEDSDCASGLCGPNGKCVKKGDMDADGVPDEDDNCPLDANKNQADVDDDGIGDACDKDNDNDRIDDSWELEYGLDPEDPNDAEEDPDDDGLINHYEFVYGTNPFEEDTDGDGHSDAKEVDKESDPLDPDSTPSGGFGFILIILIILILGVVGFFGYRYYKKTLNSLPPPKKQAQQAAARPQPKKPQPPPQLSELPLASHKVFEQKEADKKADMEKVFDAFNTENTEKLFGSKPPAQKPKPTDNLFDKFAEIPLKSGDEVFEELKRNIEEEEKLRNKRK